MELTRASVLTEQGSEQGCVEIQSGSRICSVTCLALEMEAVTGLDPNENSQPTLHCPSREGLDLLTKKEAAEMERCLALLTAALE